MKKNFFTKKLASGLALALVVASLSPAGVSAATATKIVKQDKSKAPNVLYVGDKGTDYSLSNTYKSNTYSWKISNSKIATINAKTGVVTPKAPGTVTIRVTARKASTNKWLKDFTMKIYVKLRADSIDIGAEDFTLGAGESKDLNAVKTPAKSTDTVVYASSDEKVATVDAKTGVVKAVAPGEAVITVYSKGTSKSAITSKYNRTDSVKVTVAFGVTEAKQTKANEFKLTFNGDAKDVKASEISIVKKSTNQVYAVNTVEADGVVATVKTFAALTDGSVYVLTYAGKSIEFTASNGKVTDLKINTVTIPNETATAVTVSTLDTNGVVLGTYGLDETEAKLDLALTTEEGYISDNKLVLFNVGNTAKLTATYHTFEYDESGNEVGSIVVTGIITAIAQNSVTVTDYDFTIAKTTPDFDDYTKNTKLAIGDEGYSVYFQTTDSNDVVSAAYTFETSNSDVLLVATNGSVQAVAQGTAYILVKDTDGKIVYTIPVSIVAERKATSLVLGATSATLSNSANFEDTKSVTVVVKDQYGDVFADANIAEVDVLNKPSSVTEATAAALATAAAGKVVFAAQGATVGTYVYKLTTEGLSKTVAITIKAPTTAAPVYKVVQSAKTVDTAFASADDIEDVTVKVAITRGGIVDGYVDLEADATVVLKKGTTTLDPATDYTVSGTSIIFTAVSADDTTNVVSKADAGSYSYTIEFTTTTGTTSVETKLAGGFVISDTQAGVNVTRKATSGASVTDAFKFTYLGTTVEATQVTDADEVVLTNSSSVYVKTVVVNVVITDDSVNYIVPITVTVNASYVVE
ncbi:MAG: Ig domain-containing protein [Anaerocolumna sp.]